MITINDVMMFRSGLIFQIQHTLLSMMEENPEMAAESEDGDNYKWPCLSKSMSLREIHQAII